MKKCEHNHECEQCIREEIKKKEAELAELRGKLPQNDVSKLIKKLNEQARRQYVPVPYSVPYPVPYPVQVWPQNPLDCNIRYYASLQAFQQQNQNIA
jgi:hypothetical protein